MLSKEASGSVFLPFFSLLFFVGCYMMTTGNLKKNVLFLKEGALWKWNQNEKWSSLFIIFLVGTMHVCASTLKGCVICKYISLENP